MPHILSVSLTARVVLCGASLAAIALLSTDSGAVSAAPDAEPAVPSAEQKAGGEPLRFSFFSPDWRPADLGRLGELVEASMAAEGLEVSFQAFTRYEDFVRETAGQEPDFLLAPAWIRTSTSGDVHLDLAVIARPSRHGRGAYRKALMTRGDISSIDQLARGSIAATLHSMGEGSEAAVLEAFHLGTQSAKVVAVPKDVDALLALTFGQVDAALVTSQQYEILASSNPAEAERLQVLALSPEIRLPPVFATASAAPDERRRLALALAALATSDPGREALELLGFDAFVPDPALAQAAGDPPARKPKR